VRHRHPPRVGGSRRACDAPTCSDEKTPAPWMRVGRLVLRRWIAIRPKPFRRWYNLVPLRLNLAMVVSRVWEYRRRNRGVCSPGPRKCRTTVHGNVLARPARRASRNRRVPTSEWHAARWAERTTEDVIRPSPGGAWPGGLGYRTNWGDAERSCARTILASLLQPDSCPGHRTRRWHGGPTQHTPPVPPTAGACSTHAQCIPAARDVRGEVLSPPAVDHANRITGRFHRAATSQAVVPAVSMLHVWRNVCVMCAASILDANVVAETPWADRADGDNRPCESSRFASSGLPTGDHEYLRDQLDEARCGMSGEREVHAVRELM